MATISTHPAEPQAGHNSAPARAVNPEIAGAPPPATTLAWGNSAPLALLAFAVTTFMLSMVNSNFIDAGVGPVVYGVALMFGGATQLIAGIIQLRMGNTFSGVLFAGFGAFWMSLFAIAQWFVKDVPPAQVGHALGLFIYAFGIFVVVMLAASLRTNVVVVFALAILVFAFFFLGAGNSGGHTTLIHWGGYFGLAAAACAFYLALAETLRGLLRSGGAACLAADRTLTQFILTGGPRAGPKGGLSVQPRQTSCVKSRAW